MTAIVGSADWAGDYDFSTFCSSALDDMRALGRAPGTTARLAGCTLGHLRLSFLPGDDHEHQPLKSRSRNVLLVADARIDNRDELAESLGVRGSCSDADLILACWEKWGKEALPRLLGDFTLAAWNGDRRELVLARSPASSRTLFYHAGSRFAAFATLPQPLNRLIPRTLNVEEMARRLGGGTYFGNSESLFNGIHSVNPGTSVTMSASGVSIAQFWSSRSVGTIQRRREDAAEELRWELRRAVSACLRRRNGPVASQLSGGRDSGAVTACAAFLLAEQDEQLIAYTGAPRTGFPSGQGRYNHDESAQAAAVVRQFPNIRHVVSRSTRIDLCGILDRSAGLLAAPMGNPANSYWTRILREAAQNGSEVLLTGANGNFSISLGGLNALTDVVREDGLGRWLGKARELAKSSDASWKTLLNQTFGHRIPARLHRLATESLYGPIGQAGYPAFSPRLRDEISRLDALPQTRPLASYRARVQEIYDVVDYADNLGPALYGIDLRDPTADRRLIEFCLSLSATDIVGSQGQRPIYDLAFAGLVPAEVRGSRFKGFQGADWFEIHDPEELRAGVRRYAENPVVREFVDMRQIERLLDAWPTDASGDLGAYGLYANHVLVAVSLASWLDANF